MTSDCHDGKNIEVSMSLDHRPMDASEVYVIRAHAEHASRQTYEESPVTLLGITSVKGSIPGNLPNS